MATWQIKGKKPTIMFGFRVKEMSDRKGSELERQKSPK